MRRDIGAIVLILVVLGIKLPALLANYKQSAGTSSTSAAVPAGQSESTGSAVPATGWKGTGLVPLAPRNGQDSVRPPAAPGRSPGLSRPASNRPSSSKTTPQQVPQCYFDNPLVFFSTASPESLASLPGIGPVIAERIAKAASVKQPFRQWNDLLSVKGIGPKKLEKLKRFATGQ